MTDKLENLDPNFMQLVLSLQAGAMQQMGKIMSPLSGKVERDLLLAKTSIDILDMLEKKTKGNLSDEEGKLLSHVLYELRMNYVDETKKPDEPVAETSDKPSEDEKTTQTDENTDEKKE